MLRIRFFKTGKKHQPFFKIVVANKNSPPQGGDFKAEVGNYDPRSKEVELEQDKIKHWLEQGAQPTGRVHNLLVEEGVVEGEKVAVHAPERETEEEVKEESKEETEENQQEEGEQEEGEEDQQKENEAGGNEQEVREGNEEEEEEGEQLQEEKE